MMQNTERGSGRTTAQMTSAPFQALYIWPVFGSLWYARRLAKDLGRTDLQITSLEDVEHLVGRRFRNVVIDHAAWEWPWTERQRASIYSLSAGGTLFISRITA